MISTYGKWGVTARAENYGTWKGWRRGTSHLDLIAPRVRSLEGGLLAWSVGTPKGRPVEADVVLLPDLADSTAFAAWLPSVKGKYVALSFPQPTCRPDAAWEEYAQGDPRMHAMMRMFGGQGPPQNAFTRMRAARAAADSAWTPAGGQDGEERERPAGRHRRRGGRGAPRERLVPGIRRHARLRHPLTRLPGNITIIKEIQRWIDGGGVFALAYADIDFFKPFNDRYGFTRGDEVIRMLGRLITNILQLKSPDEGFVGHVGGDDFVFLIPFGKVDEASEELIRHFDAIVPGFYDPEDKANGWIDSVTREGVRRQFPFISLSIGVAHNSLRKISHYGKLSEIASEMKRFAKKTPGSCYRIDRRKE